MNVADLNAYFDKHTVQYYSSKRLCKVNYPILESVTMRQYSTKLGASDIPL